MGKKANLNILRSAFLELEQINAALEIEHSAKVSM
jgi:hypothetical protein